MAINPLTYRKKHLLKKTLKLHPVGMTWCVTYAKNVLNKPANFSVDIKQNCLNNLLNKPQNLRAEIMMKDIFTKSLLLSQLSNDK